VREKGAWIDFQGLAGLRFRLIVATGVNIGDAKIGINHHGKRIELNRAF
jgi:hypothetical protein